MTDDTENDGVECPGCGDCFGTEHGMYVHYGGYCEGKERVESDVLKRLHHDERMAIPEMADHLNRPKKTVRAWMDEGGVKVRDGTWEKGEGGGKYPTDLSSPVPINHRDGYVRWRHRYDGKQSNVMIHRLLAVAEYGFDAVVGMDVHHGKERGHLPACEIPWANWPGNIELMDHGEHGSYHS